MTAREAKLAGQIVALAACIALELLAVRIETERNERLLALVDALDRQTEQVRRVAETFSDLAKMP
jgi:hypothetical protein